jgi:hypothetical protein
MKRSTIATISLAGGVTGCPVMRPRSSAYATRSRSTAAGKTGDAMLRADSRRYEVSAAFAAIVAWTRQTSSSKAAFVAASRVASMSSMGLFAPIGEVDCSDKRDQFSCRDQRFLVPSLLPRLSQWLPREKAVNGTFGRWIKFCPQS